VNTSVDHESEDLRYGEYVLGVLDAEARAAVEREVASDPNAAEEVARWQWHLSSLAENLPEATPSAQVWARVQTALGMKAVQPPPQTASAPRPMRSGWWNNLALWRGFAFGASAVALACVITLAVLPSVTLVTRSLPTVHYMASSLSQSDGRVSWTATMDLRNARMVVVPTKPQGLPADRAPELWLIPAGHKPIAVGMIAASGPTTIALSPALVAQLGPSAVLAVSVEPPGGSPTGQPTGPVIATGAIGAAAQSAGTPVTMLQPGARPRLRPDTGLAPPRTLDALPAAAVSATLAVDSPPARMRQSAPDSNACAV